MTSIKEINDGENEQLLYQLELDFGNVYDKKAFLDDLRRLKKDGSLGWNAISNLIQILES